MKYLLMVLLLLLLPSCADFQTKLEMMQSEQMACKPPDVSLCAGWKV